MKYTVGQAAKLTNRAKSTISRELKDGRISFEKLEDGSYAIDASELRRVYPEAFDETGAPAVPKNTEAVPSFSNETWELRLELELLRERLAMEQQMHEGERQILLDQVADLRGRADADAEERRKLTAILIDMRTPTPVEPAAPAPVTLPLTGASSSPESGPLTGFWHRLVGNKGR